MYAVTRRRMPAPLSHRVLIMQPFRKEKIASIIRQVVSEAITHKLHDPRVDTLTTITRVEMTADLLVAKVFLTINGGEAVERRTLNGVRNARGFLQRQVAEGLQIRHCPELQFDIDRGQTQARDTLALLAENLRRDPGLADPVDESAEAEAEPQNDLGRAPDADAQVETEEEG